MNTNTQPVGVEEIAREFCKNTPRLKEESGVMFYERLTKALSQAKRQGAEEAYMVLDDIDSLPDMIHPTTGEDYKKLWRMIQKRIDAFKALSAPNTEEV